MKRVKEKVIPAGRNTVSPDAREVPLMMPHGGGEAGRDFESAFELLQGNEQARGLWRRERVNISVAPAS